MLILLSILTLLLGFALFVIGLRGRRLGDHPHCTACGFDLFGLPPDSARCPECGADTRRPDAQHIGRHTRRPRPLLAGLALLLPSAAYLAITATAILTSFDLTPYKPVWWLASDITSPAAPLRKQAITELTARLSASKLTPSNCDHIARSVLSLQTSSTWYPECGDLLAILHTSGSLSEEHWKQYVANAAPKLSLTLRPRVRLGDPIVYQIMRAAAPVGIKTQLVERHVHTEIRIGDLIINRPEGGDSGIGHVGGSSSFASIQPKDYAGKLQPGRHRVTLVGKREIRSGSQESAYADTVTLTGQFDLLPADQPTVNLISDASIQAAVRKTMTPHLTTNPQGALNLSTGINKAPVGLAFHVVIITGQARQDGGSLALAAGKDVSFHHGWLHNWPADQKTATLLYEPSIEAAVNTVDVFEILNDPIQFDDLPITQR